MAYSGLQVARFHLLRHPKDSEIIFGKTHFRPIIDPLLDPKHPIFKAFWHLWRAKMGHHWLKMRQKHLFWHPTISSNNFSKTALPSCTHWTFMARWAPTSSGVFLQLAVTPMGPGSGVEGSVWAALREWKSKAMGGCTGCPQNHAFSHIAQDMVLWLILTTDSVHKFWGFWGCLGGVSRPYGPVTAPQGLFDTGK